jgi:branched-chain amino acid transport system permease protein
MSGPRPEPGTTAGAAAPPAPGVEATGPSRTQVALGRAHVAATRSAPRGRRRAWLPRQPLLRHLIVAVGGLFLIWVITSRVSSYDNFQISQIGAYLVAIAGLTVLTGLNGQLSLGHGALMMIGAYATALLGLHTHLPLAVVLVLASVATGLAGVVIVLGAARLRGPYLAGATLALAVALPAIAYRWPGTLGGDTGFYVNQPFPPSFLGADFDQQKWIAWISGFCGVLTLVVLANLIRSRYGRSFRAVRDDEIAASLVGIHVARTQVVAFVVSATCAGLGGALLALSTGTVNPLGFPVSLSIALVAAMVVGGIGSLTGALWGAILVVYLPRWTTSISNQFGFSAAVNSNLAFAFYGLALVVVMLTFPGGIQGAVRDLTRWARTRARRRRDPWPGDGTATNEEDLRDVELEGVSPDRP